MIATNRFSILFHAITNQPAQGGYLTHKLLNYLNGIIHFQFLELYVIIFKGYQDDNLYVVSQQFRAWPACIYV